MGCHFLLHGIFLTQGSNSCLPRWQAVSLPLSHQESKHFSLFHTKRKWKWSRSVMSDSLRPHGLYSLPRSSVHGIFQVRILQWVAISSSRGASRPRDQTSVSHVSCIAGRFFTSEPLQDCTGCNLGVRWIAISSEATESSFKLML